MLARPCRALLAVGLLVSGVSVAQLPPSFSQSTLAGLYGQPISMEFLPDGRLLVAEKSGLISLASGTNLSQQSAYMQLFNIENSQERGLQSIVLHPQFDQNGWFYVYYSTLSPSSFRVSRFTHVQNGGGSASFSSTASEVVIWEDPLPYSGCCHYGGGMDIGPDGKLYLAIGEHNNAAHPQDISVPHGKVLRLNLDGSVPTDNPYVDGNGPNYDAIWCEGLRNPFKLSWDATYNKLYVADVGANDPSTAREEVHVAASGGNFGWPHCEGSQCNWPISPPANVVSPLFDYPHPGMGGGAVIGGLVYRGTLFPVAYHGSYFYADFVQGWIRRAQLSANGTAVVSDNAFMTGAGLVSDMEVGTDGALYYCDLNGAVKRIGYTGSNQVPQCSGVTVTPLSGPAPLSSTGVGSVLDPEGAALTCTWLWNDGSQTMHALAAGSGWRTMPSSPHTYTASGMYDPVLRVSDGVNTVDCPASAVSVGQGPTCSITFPPDGSSFQAGDVILYGGSASDPNGALTAANYLWEVVFVHNEHAHPESGPSSGYTSGAFTVPFDGHDFSGNTGYEIRLTVTDTDGLQAHDTVRVWPEKTLLTFNSVPSGLFVEIDGVQRQTPYVLDDLVGFHHYINAPVQCYSGQQYGPSTWSNGGTGYQMIVVPAVPTSYTHTFASWGVCQTSVKVLPKVMLGGAYDQFTGLMQNNLAVLGLVPTTQPYTQMGLVSVGGGNTTTTTATLSATGGNAIVDWVWVELRNALQPATVAASRAALLQRDGDVVETDGTSPVTMNVAAGSYFVAVRHRTHLAVMTAQHVALSTSPTVVDFTLVSTATYGSAARTEVNGVMVLWPGDAGFNGVVKYTGANNDRDPILSAIGGTVPTGLITMQYRGEDVNMDGLVKYTGVANDRDPILQCIGGTVPTAVRQQQLP